ncbi:chemotaxis protein CheW [Calderihabitans maritimus]|uniref:Chemotaxis protein CheW n=1 Tax=Calderihabitans maritimus TaxID=1246530 RepID=A0A1Z5HU69_9FIRM|nr:chemotaxis protein CheW [Calderihabitans maritimus]GAW92897.1 chemotaxis signal transduction protein [Calderihabitans maritimus]
MEKFFGREAGLAEQQVTGRAEEQLVVFKLGEETYGIEISVVHEIIRMQDITEVPRTPEFVEGVINLRGRIVPVIDLRKRFGLPVGERTSAWRIMVIQMGDITVGMIVDAVLEVLRLPAGSIELPPAMITGIDTAYLRGVGKWQDRLIILLDVEKILRENEKKELQEEAGREIASALEGQEELLT